MTEQEAAKQLHVSVTHVRMLLETGEVHDLSQTAILEYKAVLDARREKGLQEMAEASERLHLYDNELTLAQAQYAITNPITVAAIAAANAGDVTPISLDDL